MWLDRVAGAADVMALLRPFDPERMEAYPVSRRVGSPANDGPDLLLPVAS